MKKEISYLNLRQVVEERPYEEDDPEEHEDGNGRRHQGSSAGRFLDHCSESYVLYINELMFLLAQMV